MQDIFEKVVQIVAGNAMLNYIADTCITVSGVIVFLLLVRPLMKRLPRIGMYVLWFMVVVRLLCPVTINGIYRMLPSQVEQSAAEADQTLRIEGIAERIEKTTKVEYAGQDNSYRLPVESSVEQIAKSGTVKETEQGAASVEPTETEPKLSEQKQWLPKWTEAQILLFVWGAGVFLCWLYMLVSLSGVRLRYADARHLRDNIYTHPLIDGSFVAGILSPKIYVPEDLSEADRIYILCHERVHIRRRDYLIKPFVFAVFSLLWFNPLIWTAYHFMMKDMEISCDEAVMRTLGSEAKARYSYLLLSMTGSKGSFLGQNPAFSAGTLRERIANVMKYKRPTAFVTAVAMVVVVLCSCGLASTPQKAENNVAEKEKKIYVEQTLPCFAGVAFEGGKTVDFDLPQMDAEGLLVNLPAVYDYQGETSRLEKVKLTDGEWHGTEGSWLAEYEKMFDQDKKAFSLTKYQYAGDGYLYLTVWEYSMSLNKFRSDREKYEDAFYLRDIHFVKVDEEAGTLTEIKVPTESVEEVLKKQYGENIPDDCQTKGVAAEAIYVLGNGNLYITDSGNICGIYSQSTGEKLADGRDESAYSFTGIVPGDDFYCCGVADLQTKQLEIEVYDESGELINSLSTGVEATKEKLETAGNYQGAALGVKGNTILLATAEGIFEAEPEDEEFTKVIDSARDNLYYLSEEYEIEPNSLFKGENEDYYLILYKETANSGPYDDYYLCHYSAKE